MEKTCLNKFVGVFDLLNNALSIIKFELGYKESEYKNSQNIKVCTDYENSMEHNRCIGWKDILEPNIEKRTNEIKESFILQIDNHTTNLLYNLKNEIDSNLYSLSSEDRLLYIKDIVRQFADIAPYFDISIETNFKIGSYTSENTTKKCSKHLLEYFSSEFYKCGEKYETLSISKKYFYCCHELLDLFVWELEKLCDTFEIDFAAVQRDLGIYLQWHDGDIIQMNDKYSKPDKQPEALDEDLDKIFRSHTKDDFIRLEGILRTKGMIGDDGHWSVKKGSMTALKKFISNLRIRNYFKDSVVLDLRNGSYDYKALKPWIKKRYGIENTQIFEPKRMSNFSAHPIIDKLDYGRF